MIDIVNHSVKIDDIGLLQFMYPDYIILDKPILFIDKPIIFKQFVEEVIANKKEKDNQNNIQL